MGDGWLAEAWKGRFEETDTLFGCDWMDLMGRAWRCRIAIADKLDLDRYSFKVVLGSFGCRSEERNAYA